MKIERVSVKRYVFADNYIQYWVIRNDTRTIIGYGAGTGFKPVGVDTTDPEEIELRDYCIANWDKVADTFLNQK